MAYSRLQIYDLGREIKGTKWTKIYLKKNIYTALELCNANNFL